MKANELMVGDYVGFLPTWKNEDGTIQREGNPNNPIICKVEMLGSSGAQLDNGEDYFDADDIELYPIPITPEILEKNGFINGEFYAESHIEDWQILSDCSHLAARHSSGWCLDIQCEYVHELQHAFRLFKLEKDIVL